jgi:prepilin-type N-terminal cleavage/methylation domain-containing protein
MKINKRGFTVIEVLTAWAIFALLWVWIVWIHRFMLNENNKTLETIKWNLFSSYIRDSIQNITVPNYPKWQEFYLNFLGENLTFSNSQFDSEWRIWFFNADENNDFSHKITYIWPATVDSIELKLYKIEANYWIYSTSYYITK